MKKEPGQTAQAAFARACGFNPTWEAMGQTDRQIWAAVETGVLASPWRSVDDPPEFEGDVVWVWCQGGWPEQMAFRFRSVDATHWCGLCPPLPTPDPVDVGRKEFETWARQHFLHSGALERYYDGKTTQERPYTRCDVNDAWQAWQAARVKKEIQP